MRDFKPLFVLVIPFSFLFGLWWGYSLFKAGPAESEMSLRLLTFETPFPDALQKKLLLEKEIMLEVDHAPDLVSWRKMIAEKDYDLLFARHAQVEDLQARQLIAPLPGPVKTYYKDVAVDFKNLAFDRENHFFLPLLWGAMGFLIDKEKVSQPIQGWKDLFAEDLKQKVALSRSPFHWFSDLFFIGRISKDLNEVKTLMQHFQLVADEKPVDVPIVHIAHGKAMSFKAPRYQFVHPEELNRVWVQGFLVTSKVRNMKNVEEALKFFSTAKTALQIQKQSGHASTHLALEKSSIDPGFKPSYFRQLSLRKLRMGRPYFEEVEKLNEIIEQKHSESSESSP